jgi:hypothetical protein
LKKHLGAKVVPSPELPLIDSQGNIQVTPELIMPRRVIPRNNVAVVQWKIKWVNLPKELATWEDETFVKAVFPVFHTQGLV